jgi:hypothetical protein
VGNKKSTILVLNGKHYDALTGELVTPGPGAKAVRPIDDFGGPRTAPRQPEPQPRPAPVAHAAPKSTAKSMDVRPQPKHLRHRTQQRSETLIRSAVSKPAPGLKSRVRAQHASLPATVATQTIEQKYPVSEVNPKRLRRAEHVAKSQLISKFAPGQPEFNPVAAASVRVEPFDEPLQLASGQQSQELFASAIAAANSHEERYISPKKLAKTARKEAKHAAKTTKRRPRHHLASAVAASFLVLAIGSFVALQNKSAITMRFADAKAGFHASVPGYQPQGYSVGDFSYSAGNVAMKYHDSGADRYYTIRQQTTKWNDDELLDNFVKANYTSYQILQAGQQIIYVYGDNDASWVKDGVWYQLTSGGSLSSSQVLSIATSV